MTERLINTFSELGRYLVKFTENYKADKDQLIDDQYRVLTDAVVNSYKYNQWFTTDNVLFAIKSIAGELKEEKLREWISSYTGMGKNAGNPKKVGVIMAGNIPLVGFFDYLYVLFSGHRIIAKLSSGDRFLLPAINNYLISIFPEIEDRVEFCEGRLEGIDAVIATGSNNSYRYFEYYFGKYPGILRKNRNSIAVITEEDINNALKTPEDNTFTKLAADIFSYFGLGCRNISKILVPAGFDIRNIFPYFEGYTDIIFHNKYHNNYEYYKSIYLINGNDFLDTGFALFLKDETNLASPVSVVLYDEYKGMADVTRFIEVHNEEIQCVVSTSGSLKNTVLPGNTQCPSLKDYADGCDVIDLLLQL